jgi:hypothetical protein
MYSRSIKGSLIATTFTWGFLREARKTMRPMRPKLLDENVSHQDG